MAIKPLVVFITMLLALAACQPSPPTVVYIVISPTPEDHASPEPSGSAVVAQSAANTPSSSPTPAPIRPTSTPNALPTPTIGQIQVAEQVYEGGRMFWLQPTSQIWVMVVDDVGRGRWFTYEDTFDETTDPATDPELSPPEGRYQPERGFGKLWRDNPEIREMLGWAITPEFGYISQYEYHPSGSLQDGVFVPSAGYHKLFSLNNEVFRFQEADYTWRLDG